MNLVAIMTILTIVTGITGIIAAIFLFMALGNIKMINYRLNSRYLDEFRSKYITAFILKLVCIPFLIGGIVLMVMPIGFMSHEMMYFPSFYLLPLVIGIIPMVIAFILFIIAYSVEMKAWDNLKYFLEENRSMFPEYIARESIDGAEKLRTGALLYVWLPFSSKTFSTTCTHTSTTTSTANDPSITCQKPNSLPVCCRGKSRRNTSEVLS
jgi:hypothetical protein